MEKVFKRITANKNLPNDEIIAYVNGILQLTMIKMDLKLSEELSITLSSLLFPQNEYYNGINFFYGR